MNFVPKKPGEEIDERFCTIGESERVEEEEHFGVKKSKIGGLLAALEPKNRGDRPKIRFFSPVRGVKPA